MTSILYLDLDGTVIGSNGVTDAVWNAIGEARDKGARMAVCTGRPCGGIAQRIAKHASPDGPHIFESGGIVTPADGPPWQAATLDIADLNVLIEHSKTTEAVLELYTPAGVFVSKYNADCKDHERVLEIEVNEADLAEVAATQQVMRAHWIMRPETVEATLAPTLANSHVAVASSPVLPNNVFASITVEGTDKGSAVRFVNDRLQAQETWGVGDSVGDLPMLEAVDRPFVMVEAPEDLRQRFETLPSVEDDGLLVAIRAFVDRLH